MVDKKQNGTVADVELRDRLEWVLDFDPGLKSTDIRVIVQNGEVTLSGFVETYAEKVAAANAVRRTSSVRAVANEIEVKQIMTAKDLAIALAASEALTERPDLTARIKVTVQKRWLYMDGRVDHANQREAAESVVKQIPGLLGVTNRLEIRPRVSQSAIRRRIEAALGPASDDARRIRVTTCDSTVELWGSVSGWSKKDKVERAAWSTAGVHNVKSHLNVRSHARN
jgi:osmotically-inducible protein OsmY